MDQDDESPDDEGTVLSPQELELAEKEGVEQLGEGRFVVSPDGSEPSVPTELTAGEGERSAAAEAAADDADAVPERSSGSDARLTRTEVQDWHERQLTESPCAYGYHLSLKAGDVVDHHTLHSDDVTMSFNNLLLWYARTVDADLPPGAVIGILLSDASVPVQFPAKTLERFLMAKGLSTEDSIEDLLEVVRDDGGLIFPPRRE